MRFWPSGSGVRPVLAAVLGCALVLTTAPTTRAAAPRSVTVIVGAPVRRLPPDFFGVSFETNEMSRFEAAGATFDHLLALVRPGAGVPLPVRVGGRSADETYWLASAKGAGRWISELDSRWPDGLARLVRADNLRVQLNVNLAVHSPAMAVRFVADVARRLPAGTLSGVAIGNEPDLYRLQRWLDRERVATTTPGTPRSWTTGYNSARYVSDFRAYARALQHAFPGVQLLGPELSYPSLGWPSDLLALGGRAPVSLTFHRYALADCTPDQARRLPSPRGFLDDRFSAGLAGTLADDIRFGRAHGLAVRVSEMNTVACGGPAALVQSFATALWVPDALFEMAKVGVASVNWHIRAAMTNAPVAFGTIGMTARPELYGLATYARMVGPGGDMLDVRLDSPQSGSLKAWAIRVRGALRILLINKSPQAVRARIVPPPGISREAGSLIRLLGPSVMAQHGVTLGGQTIGPDGRWLGHPLVEAIRFHRDGYGVGVGAYSAALLDLR